MSTSRTEYIICPKCGKESRHRVRLSWNSWQNPELFEPDGRKTINQFTCRHCKHTISARRMNWYIPLQYKPWFLKLLQIVHHDKQIAHTLKDEEEKKRLARYACARFWFR